MNIPAPTIEQSIKKLESIDTIKDLPELAVIRDVINNKVVALGTDEAFALRDNDGEIRAFRQSLTLSKANGGLIQPVAHGPFVVSAQGYEMWAEAAGACVIFPKEVLVANQWQPNPYAERDQENRRILAVHARAVAFRFSSKGIPQVSDWTTIFDTPSYRMIDLLAKAKTCPQAFRLLPSKIKPSESESDTWASYPFDESTNLWLNTSHDEALTWFSQILNREKKSMDFAQTFAKRNALKHLSGLQKSPFLRSEQNGKFKNEIYADTWTMPVLCWRPTSGNIIKWDATTYKNLRDRVGGLITSNGEDFQTKRIESKAGSERVSDESGFESMEAATDPEDQVIDIEPSKTESAHMVGATESNPNPPRPRRTPLAQAVYRKHYLRKIKRFWPILTPARMIRRWLKCTCRPARKWNSIPMPITTRKWPGQSFTQWKNWRISYVN